MKFIATSRNKVETIPVEKGQLIFSRDSRTIYLDSDVRTEFNTFIILDTEDERTKLISPVNGFYFIEETKILWRHNNSKWFPLNEKPEQNIVFVDNGAKPLEGKINTLYVDDNKLYRWEPTLKRYTSIGDIGWEPISSI